MVIKEINKKIFNYNNGQHVKFLKHVFSENIGGFFELPINRIEENKTKKKFDNLKFLNRCKKLYNNRYDYSNSKVLGWNMKFVVKCNNCKEKFNVTASNHLHNKIGCLECYVGKPQNSKGEIKIATILKRKKISYIRQYSFNDCVDLAKLRFDFYLPEQNLLIEFDGKQHFQPIEFFGGKEAFKIQEKRDKIKNEQAKKHSINLLRIPYTKYDNIETILENNLMQLTDN
jgi:very-short-patch-repair endonuclease